MKRIRLALALGVLILTSPLPAQTPQGPLDIVFLKDTSKRVGRVLGADAQMLRLQIPLPGAGAGAAATVTIPRTEVVRVEFAESEPLERLLRSPSAADLPRIESAWNQWSPFLSLPKSPAGRVGNAFGSLLLQTNDAGRVALALDVFAGIEKQGWNEDDRIGARQGRLRAMVATGRAAEAVNEAKELASVVEDPAVLIEAKYILAAAAHKELAKLLDENPRWEEDDNVRPERHRLYHDAIDLYLYPYLFYGSQSEAASRGLWGAVEVYQLAGETHNAVESARDLTALYPGISHSKLASDFLSRLPDAAKQHDNEKNAQHEL